jgi:hypothetical protein
MERRERALYRRGVVLKGARNARELRGVILHYLRVKSPGGG